MNNNSQIAPQPGMVCNDHDLILPDDIVSIPT